MFMIARRMGQSFISTSEIARQFYDASTRSVAVILLDAVKI